MTTPWMEGIRLLGALTLALTLVGGTVIGAGARPDPGAEPQVVAFQDDDNDDDGGGGGVAVGLPSTGAGTTAGTGATRFQDDDDDDTGGSGGGGGVVGLPSTGTGPFGQTLSGAERAVMLFGLAGGVLALAGAAATVARRRRDGA